MENESNVIDFKSVKPPNAETFEEYFKDSVDDWSSELDE